MNNPDSRTISSDKLRSTDVRVEVRNFGPIESGAVDMRPLTVFVGPSNTGKTYFAILIYALRRVLGGFPRLPFIGWFYHDHRLISESLKPRSMDFSTKKKLKILLDKMNNDARNIRISDFPEILHDVIRNSLEHPEFLPNDVKNEIVRCFDVESLSDLIHLSGKSDKANLSLIISEENRDLWRLCMDMSRSEIVANSHVSDMTIFPNTWIDSELVHRELSGLKDILNRELRSTRNWRSRPYLLDLFDKLFMSTDSFAEEGNGAHYLPAARSGIMQSHRVIASSLVTRSTRVGLERFPELPTFSGVMADFMQRLILHEDSEPDDQTMKKLADQLESEALAGRIRTNRPTPGGYPEFVYRPRNTEQDIRLTRASSMVSELAPVVLFLRGAVGRGDTLIIEEPEAHLHPAAQTRVALTLARMVRAGVRVVVTTHSDWLLKEIGNLMREGELGEQAGQSADEEELPSSLRPGDVGIWLFRKDESASGSTVEEIPFDRIEGVEPRDYEDVAEALYNRSADLQNRLEETGGEETTGSGHE